VSRSGGREVERGPLAHREQNTTMYKRKGTESRVRKEEGGGHFQMSMGGRKKSMRIP